MLVRGHAVEPVREAFGFQLGAVARLGDQPAGWIGRAGGQTGQQALDRSVALSGSGEGDVLLGWFGRRKTRLSGLSVGWCSQPLDELGGCPVAGVAL